MSYSTTELVSQLYVIYCGRPADPEGLNFWSRKVAESKSLQAGLILFDNGTEFAEGIDKQDTLAVIAFLFTNAVERLASVREQAYFLALSQKNNLAVTQLAQLIIESLDTDDKSVFQQRHHRAKEYTAMIERSGRVYDSESIAEARQFMQQSS